MSFQPPELASRPFLNLRPVRRLSILMWVVGGVILVLNIWLYGTAVTSRGDDRDRLLDLESRRTAAAEEVSDLKNQVAGLQLTWQNRQAEFLNHLIDQRTFSWSDLIDRLAEVLPREVRLVRLTPRVKGGRSTPANQGPGPREKALRVELGMAGSAADDAALLRFLDQMFQHPGFENPRLASQTRGERGEVASFSLTVAYLPGVMAAAGPDEPAEEEAP